MLSFDRAMSATSQEIKVRGSNPEVAAEQLAKKHRAVVKVVASLQYGGEREWQITAAAKVNGGFATLLSGECRTSAIGCVTS